MSYDGAPAAPSKLAVLGKEGAYLPCSSRAPF
jgi:hypothetical protein